uniref:ABC transporter domain-containing protein n=1 Tax=Mycena chlorophos TaxID=658473 RepID=A0ABQ0KVX9_MYCCL|nr:predicted protein [Mycena chlorophos]
MPRRTPCAGGNLSVGQRLARAIVWESKILILDETLHYKTNAIIKKSLREELTSDVSLLTVADRLQTSKDSDRIMVSNPPLRSSRCAPATSHHPRPCATLPAQAPAQQPYLNGVPSNSGGV